MYCCFIDFEKAFDKVWRDGLWYKLLLNNMDGNMHNVILNMYKENNIIKKKLLERVKVGHGSL
jgi:hypothetical protein